MTQFSNPFILVDGSSYLFRAYHALPPLTNSQGHPCGALYGVINMLRNLINKYQPKHIAVVFDTKGKNFRHELYSEYKANRPPMPEELAIQIKPLHDIIEAMGFPLLAVEGVEADDVIGTLARQAEQHGLQTLISTGDKDMAQLVTVNIHLINTMTNKYMDNKGVVEKFGVEPELMIDYLSLVGDTVDNVPGVKKVGPKTAVKLLNQYGNLQGVIDNAHQVSGKLGENLRDAIPTLPLSKKLVTINENVTLNVTPKELTRVNSDNDKLKAYFKEFEFKKWLAEFDDDTSVTPNYHKSDYEMVNDEKRFEEWLDILKQSEIFAFDTETTSLDYMQAKIVGLSFAVKDKAAYVPLAHQSEKSIKQLDKKTVLQKLQKLFADEKKTLVGQHIKYDLEVLANENVRCNANLFDTMLESYVLDSQATRHDMDSLANKYLNRSTISYEDVAGKGAKQIPFAEVNVDKATEYAAEDAEITLQLHDVLWKAIAKDSKLKSVLTDIELPLIRVLTDIERTGVLIDIDLLQKQSELVSQQLEEFKIKIFELAGEEFNINSTKQLQQIFYDKLKLPILKKTPKGQPSTAEAVLQELALSYPLPKYILNYRSLSKLKSTYIDALPTQIDKDTGRIHTSYHQAVTATGRLSSSNPNLQNIPVRTQEGRKIRKAFIACPEYKILAADYSQIELRIMAHLSQDKGLLDAFANGLDVHKATAAEVFSVVLDQVSPEQRRHAKAINFGLIYGMSAFGLSRQLGLDRNNAQLYIDRYFDRYPGVKKYMEQTTAQAHEQGYVETFFSRRLYLPNINSKNFQLRTAAERAAINAPLQGTAADIIKIAMINMHRWLQEKNCRAKMIMQVHDELVFEVHQDDVKFLNEHVKAIMSNAASLNVELLVDVGVGENWDEAH